MRVRRPLGATRTLWSASSVCSRLSRNEIHAWRRFARPSAALNGLTEGNRRQAEVFERQYSASARGSGWHHPPPCPCERPQALYAAAPHGTGLLMLRCSAEERFSWP